jgi:DNA polymerase-3 subunit epsilon
MASLQVLTRGYRCLAFGKNTLKNAKKMHIVGEYAKMDHARAHLTAVVRHYELCYRLTHLDASENACFHYSIRQCKGACAGHESAVAYNQRVDMAIAHMDKHLEGSFLLMDEGRHKDEKTVFGVREGHFVGFGYFDVQDMPERPDLYFEQFSHRNNNDPEAPRIIRGCLAKKGKVQVLKY